jgi:co-chaperonin GroES (HSP10)
MNAPLNNILATITNKYYDFVEFESGIKIYKDTGFHPEESAMLQAMVISVPRAIQHRSDYAGMRLDVHPGDSILMRYDVVYSYVHQPDRDTPIYKNVVLFGGNEYWKVDIQKIFGVIHPDSMEMINGYVCGEILYDSIENSTIIIPEHYKNVQRRDKMRIKYIGAPLEGHPILPLQPGDIIYTQPGVAQCYEINDQSFYIIKQSHILAKQENIVKY